MVSYFHHLSGVQAKHYLILAGFNLRLTVELVLHDRRRLFQLWRWRMLPDGGRMEAALRVAAAQVKHPAPGILARVMTAEYPAGMLAVATEKIRGTEVLAADDVWEIMDLLDRQWPPARVPQARLEFWCRPEVDDGRGTCTKDINGTLHISTRAVGDVVINITSPLPKPPPMIIKINLMAITSPTWRSAPSISTPRYQCALRR